MNRSEVQELIRRYSTIDGTYTVWRESMLRSISERSQEARAKHWESCVDSYARTLAGTDYADASLVLDGMELYELPTLRQYEYGKIGVVLAEAANLKRAERLEREERTGVVDEPRFTCIRCWDRGMVTAYNPYWLAEFRPTFERLEENGFTPGWFGVAYRQWQREKGDRGPLVTVMRCDCDCKAATRWYEKQREYDEGKRSRPPACGMAVYDDRNCQVAGVKPARDLAEFYERIDGDG